MYREASWKELGETPARATEHLDQGGGHGERKDEWTEIMAAGGGGAMAAGVSRAPVSEVSPPW